MQNSVVMPGFQNVQNTVQTPKTIEATIQNNAASSMQNQTAVTAPLNNENKSDDKNKKIALALAGLAAVGAAAIGITYAIRHGKKPDVETPIEILSNDKLIENVKKAKEEGFTGIIKGLLKNDDTVELTYKNGKIIKSVKEGAESFVKEYSDNGVKTYNKAGELVSELQKTENGHNIFSNGEIVTKYAKIDDNTHRVINCGIKADSYRKINGEVINEYTMKDGKIFAHKKIDYDVADTYYKDKSSLISHKYENFDKNGTLVYETRYGNIKNPTCDFISQDKHYRSDGTLSKTNINKKDGTFISEFFSEDGKQINTTIEQRDIAPMANGWTSKELKITENGQTRYLNIHGATGSNVKITEEFDSNKKFTGKTKETIKHRKEDGKTYTDTITEIFDADGNLLNTETKSVERKFIDL